MNDALALVASQYSPYQYEETPLGAELVQTSLQLASLSKSLRSAITQRIASEYTKRFGWESFHEHPLLRWTEAGMLHVFENMAHHLATQETLLCVLSLWDTLSQCATTRDAARRARTLRYLAKKHGKQQKPSGQHVSGTQISSVTASTIPLIDETENDTWAATLTHDGHNLHLLSEPRYTQDLGPLRIWSFCEHIAKDRKLHGALAEAPLSMRARWHLEKCMRLAVRVVPPIVALSLAHWFRGAARTRQVGDCRFNSCHVMLICLNTRLLWDDFLPKPWTGRNTARSSLHKHCG